MFGLFDVKRAARDEYMFAEPTMAETYRDILRDYSLRRVNRVIENDTFEDSSSVYERFFLDSQSQVRIVARGIKKEIFDRPNVIAAAKHFLARGGCKLTLDIRAKDKQDAYKASTTEFVRAVLDSASGTDRLSMNFYEEARGREFLRGLPSVSFGDDRMYRKRSFQPEGDYSTHANAEVNFNDPGKVIELSTLIDAGISREVRLG